MHTPARNMSRDDFFGGLLSSWQFLAKIAWEDGRRSVANERELRAAECLHEVMHHRDHQPEM